MITASMRFSMKNDPTKTMSEQNRDGRKKDSCQAILYIIWDQLSRVMTWNTAKIESAIFEKMPKPYYNSKL